MMAAKPVSANAMMQARLRGTCCHSAFVKRNVSRKVANRRGMAGHKTTTAPAQTRAMLQRAIMSACRVFGRMGRSAGVSVVFRVSMRISLTKSGRSAILVREQSRNRCRLIGAMLPCAEWDASDIYTAMSVKSKLRPVSKGEGSIVPTSCATANHTLQRRLPKLAAAWRKRQASVPVWPNVRCRPWAASQRFINSRTLVARYFLTFMARMALRMAMHGHAHVGEHGQPHVGHAQRRPVPAPANLTPSANTMFCRTMRMRLAGDARWRRRCLEGLSSMSTTSAASMAASEPMRAHGDADVGAGEHRARR